jgi:Nuclear pore complex scaffold, nucleoporins 186/192/205
MRLFVPSITEARNELEQAIHNGEGNQLKIRLIVEYLGLVIVVEAKLAVLLEVSRTRSGATQILQSQFFDVFKGFALTPNLLVQRNPPCIV